MAYNNNLSMMDKMLYALQKAGDISLAYAFQREMAKSQILEKDVYDRIVHEVTQQVLENIRVNVDISDAIMQIEELKRAIDSLRR